MKNRIDICNMALAQLGMEQISSWDDDRASARQVKIFYNVCKERLLREYNWSFAIKEEKLTQIANKEGVADFPIVCNLPNNASRIIRLGSRRKYLKRENLLYVQNADDTVLYIKEDIEACEFDSAFADSLACAIASKLAFANRDTQLASYYDQQMQQRIAAAKAIDSIENIHDFQQGRRRSKFIEARQ